MARKKDKKELPKDIRNQQAVSFDNSRPLCIFDKVPITTVRNSAKFSFGSASRLTPAKVYFGSEHTGLNQASPGPKYRVQENSAFRKPPGYSFGRSMRATSEVKLKYNHYAVERSFDSVDLTKVQQSTIKNTGRATIDKAPRLMHSRSVSPGPIYFAQKPVTSEPGYTIGKSKDKPKLPGCTAPRVGPGTYVTDSWRQQPNQRYSFPRQKRKTQQESSPQRSESPIESYSARTQSQFRSTPQFAFTRSTRDGFEKQGYFRDSMSKNYPRVQIRMRNV